MMEAKDHSETFTKPHGVITQKTVIHWNTDINENYYNPDFYSEAKSGLLIFLERTCADPLPCIWLTVFSIRFIIQCHK
jgi:hypothetical protein